MNRRGFLALMDAVIFIAVVMLAMTALLTIGAEQEQDDRDASPMLESLMSAQVRMSDLVEDGDGSLVRVSDLCALLVTGGETSVGEYLAEVLDAMSGPGTYRLELMFAESSTSVGTGDGRMLSSYTMEVPVTTGGTLTAVLSVFSS